MDNKESNLDETVGKGCDLLQPGVSVKYTLGILYITLLYCASTISNADKYTLYRILFVILSMLLSS